jgi:hypothetical protein
MIFGNIEMNYEKYMNILCIILLFIFVYLIRVVVQLCIGQLIVAKHHPSPS